MKKDINEEVRTFLTEKMMENISILVRYYVVEHLGSDKDKKTANASKFLESMMSGEGFIKDDQPLADKHKKLWEKANDYAKAMNTISKIKENK